MRTRLLPQRYCADVTDHRPHTKYSEVTGAPWYFCPGRYTPSDYRAPASDPATPEDPFAGIPGADED